MSLMPQKSRRTAELAQQAEAACDAGDLKLLRAVLRAARGHCAAVLAWCNPAGATLLEAAVSYGSEETVRCLLEEGANPNLPTMMAPALRRAARRGHVSIIATLIEYGVDLDARDPKDGFTALMAAIQQHKSEAALFLIENGAACGPDVLSDGKWDAAGLALANDDPAVFMVLYRVGAVRVNESILTYVLRAGGPKVLAACLSDPDLRRPAEGAVLSPDLLANCWTIEMRQSLLAWHSERLISAALGGNTSGAVRLHSRSRSVFAL